MRIVRKNRYCNVLIASTSFELYSHFIPTYLTLSCRIYFIFISHLYLLGNIEKKIKTHRNFETIGKNYWDQYLVEYLLSVRKKIKPLILSIRTLKLR